MRVVEAATTALGEIGDPTAVPWLIETSANHENALVREAAIAALGSIGDQRSLPTLLEAVRTGKPQIRRRAVVALTAFEGPEVEAALTTARLDRNPMVREVAEMVLGRETRWCSAGVAGEWAVGRKQQDAGETPPPTAHR